MKSKFSISLLFIISFIFVTNLCYSQKEYFNADWEKCSKKEAKYYRIIEALDDGLYSIKDYYITGEIQFESLSKNKVDPLDLIGLSTFYFKSGKISSTQNYVNGKLEGSIKSYYPDGTVYYHGEFKDNIPNGKYREYFPHGKPRGEMYYENGLISGEFIGYYINGQKEYHYKFKDGLKEGEFTVYYEDGNLMHKGNYTQGLISGNRKTYHENGKIYIDYNIKDEKLDGTFLSFNEEGDTIAIGQFKDGKMLSYDAISHGTFNGSKFKFKAELKNGIEEWQLFRHNALILEYQFKEGKRTGIWILYDLKGKEIYAKRDFSESNCDDIYIQELDGKQIDFLLSSRFYDEGIWSDFDCKDYTSIFLTKNKKLEHAINTQIEYVEEVKELIPNNKDISNISVTSLEENKDGSAIATIDISYISKDSFSYVDPSHRDYFVKKNNCKLNFNDNYPTMDLCIRNIDGLVYKIYTSLNADDLKTIKDTVNVKGNEVVMLYQRFEDKIYPKGTGSKDRYFDVVLSDNYLFGLNHKIVTEYDLVGAFEKDIFDVDDFSGFMAFDVIESILENIESIEF